MKKVILLVLSLMILYLPIVAQAQTKPTIDKEVVAKVQKYNAVITVDGRDSKNKKIHFKARGVRTGTGYIWTDSHLIHEGILGEGPVYDKLSIKMNGEEVAIVKDFPYPQDFLVLKLQTEDLPPLEMKKDSQRGDTVFACNDNSSISLGKIINVTKENVVDSTSLAFPGDSGSGLWSPDAQLVGIIKGFLYVTVNKKVQKPYYTPSSSNSIAAIHAYLKQVNSEYILNPVGK